MAFLEGGDSMYDIVIGLEIHVEMKTQTKLFCGCSTKFGAAPNTQVCPICLGLPGSLPQVNKEAVSLAIRAGGVFGSTIQPISQFSRKNYMYPDLPKAYQITQYQEPICTDGGIEIMRQGERVMIRLERIHMEEDPGKLMHPEYEHFSLADYNRSGIPLIEIVTKPDLQSPEEAVEFLKSLRAQLDFAGISDCRMDQGSMRCDANISLKEPGTDVLGTRVEIKNINSFREVQKALEKEVKRQSDLLRFGEGDKIVQETRKWDAGKGRTIPMRSKEDAEDYRFFDDPDLPVIQLTQEQIDAAWVDLPTETALQRRERFQTCYNLNLDEATKLTEDAVLARLMDQAGQGHSDPRKLATWILTEGLRLYRSGEGFRVDASTLLALIERIESGELSHSAAKQVFEVLWEKGTTVDETIADLGLKQNSDQNELMALIAKIVGENPKAVEEIKAGNGKAFGFLMGAVMKASRGAANPKIAKALIEAEIDKLN
jgi:aspartyl-tRNA(Asn)/glutamyl-tRNA(Gln) amidotransferase subunit B